MIRTLLALAAIVIAGHANATDRSYTFVELNYSHYENESADWQRADASAKGIRASFELGNSGTYLLGEYRDFEYDDFVFDTQPLMTSRLAEIGVGYAHQIHPRADIFLEVTQQRSTYAQRVFNDGFSTFKENSDGERLSVGTRASFNDHVEASVKLNHFRNDRCDCSQNGYSLGLLAKVHRHVALTAEYERYRDAFPPGVFGGPGAILTAGIRASF